MRVPFGKPGSTPISGSDCNRGSHDRRSDDHIVWNYQWRFQVFRGALAEARGKPQLYHETITWAYVFLIQERMASARKKQSWDEFASCNSDLLVWKNGILTRYYRAETLASDLARAVFVLPDLRT